MDRDPGLLSPDIATFNERSTFEHTNNNAPDSPPSAYDTPYDPPNTHHDDGDIAMHHMDEPHSARPSTTFSKGDYGYQPAGSAFDHDSKSLLSTAKRYDHRESRKFLLRTGAYRFFMTLGFSFLIGISLKAYEGFKNPMVMNKSQVRVFNALMLGLSLGLGLNLASSLKKYAVILRWYLLTRRYVSLEVFDLILGLETLTKVGKLLVISLPGIGPRGPLRFLRKFPWFREGRDDGTRFTWLACSLWILLNVGAQILVAALSLFWPVENSSMPLQTWGNVTVANLTTWSNHIPGDRRWLNSTAMESAWNAGMEATVYPTFDLDDQQMDLSSLPGTPLYKGDDFYEYRFYNRDPEAQYKNYQLSSRSVQARASCRKVDTKGDIQYREDDDGKYLLGNDEGQGWRNWMLPSRSNGSLTWIAHTKLRCGPRCTKFTVLQDKDKGDITNYSLFNCNSTLLEIQGESKEFIHLSAKDRQVLYSNDDFARIAAGSIGWTGTKQGSWVDLQTRSYLGGSKWSPYKMVDKKEVEDLLARFTIGAIAAFDDHGIRYNLTNQPSRPIQGQQLQPDWPYILSLLGGICFIQLAALICLLLWGNKSVIRDESFWSMAMLLSPVIKRIGKEGMNLSGDEIKSHPKLLWKRIKYDYVEGKEGEPNRVDVVFLGRGEYEARRSWAPGVYT